MQKMIVDFEMKRSDMPEGKAVGIVEGYVSTFGNVDSYGDRVMKGAFNKSLEAMRAAGAKYLPLLWQHDSRELIGGFVLEKMREDDHGLYAVAEIDLGTKRGKEAHSLLMKGFLSKFSIGYCTIKESIVNGVRELLELDLMETSVVTIPANNRASVTGVKSVVPFKDLPIAMSGGEPDTARAWDSDAAVARLRDFTDSEEEPSAAYKNAFLWYDAENASEFGAYKLPVADVIDGELKVVPRAIFAAAAAMAGARGGVDIPEEQRGAVIANIERYYDKMNLESPFDKGLGVNEIKAGSVKDLKNALRAGVKFSGPGAEFMCKYEAGRRKGGDGDGPSKSGVDSDFIKQMRQFAAEVKGDRHA